MAKKLFELEIVILGFALFDLILGIGHGFILAALHIINLGDIVRNNGFVIGFILHHPEAFESLAEIAVAEGNETIIIIGIDIIGIIRHLADGIKQWFGLGKSLHGKIGIALVEFHIGYLAVIEVGYVGLFI